MGKQTFRVTLVISMLILAFLGGLQTVFVEADPFVVLPPPVIRIGSANGTTYSESTVTIPYWVEVYPMGIEISNFSCSFDGKLLDTTVPISHKSLILTELSNGKHTIAVTLIAKATFTSNAHFGVYWDTKEVSENVTFIIDTTKATPVPSTSPTPTNPQITIISALCQEAKASFNFTAKEPCSWIGYSLDGKETVTISGNVTTTWLGLYNHYYCISDLTAGKHNVTFYARDDSGNSVQSNALSFTISEQTPTPTPATTMEPTIEPIQTATSTPTGDSSFTLDTSSAAIGVTAAIALVAGGALVYLRKRKRS